MSLPVSDFSYSLSFEEEKQNVVAQILRWGKTKRSEPIDLTGHESLVAVKNTDGVLTAENDVFRKVLADGRSTIGTRLNHRLDNNLLEVSKNADQLILDGVHSLQMEHLKTFESQSVWKCITFKRRLDELSDPAYSILTLSRPLRQVFDDKESQRKSISEQLTILRQLDETDQIICRGYANGDTTKEIANRVGLTTRSVEIRRQKMMNSFGFSRPVEIVKLIVRLEERGLI